MNRSAAQALLTLLVYSQKAVRQVALATARRAVADGISEVETDLQALARDVDTRIAAVANPGLLIDDGNPARNRTWSSARIRLELDALRSEMIAGDELDRVVIPAGLGTGLLAGLPPAQALAVPRGSTLGTAPHAPSGAGTGHLTALPIVQSPPHGAS